MAATSFCDCLPPYKRRSILYEILSFCANAFLVSVSSSRSCSAKYNASLSATHRSIAIHLYRNCTATKLSHQNHSPIHFFSPPRCTVCPCAFSASYRRDARVPYPSCALNFFQNRIQFVRKRTHLCLYFFLRQSLSLYIFYTKRYNADKQFCRSAEKGGTSCLKTFI